MRGAPYVPTHPKSIEHMLGFARPAPGEKAADIGSGDGRLLIALGRAGVEAHGYEINPLLVLLSRWRIRRAGLSDKAFVHWRNFWAVDFSEFQIVTVFGIGHIMRPLETKLQKELPVGARVISNIFPFPNWHPDDALDGILLYTK
jgi:16S rRNA A1518/A1519 N6-dimethyltransferase RsmA/KsgA/DIM1 with predicted DNA glycosylase/AP lyase activity